MKTSIITERKLSCLSQCSGIAQRPKNSTISFAITILKKKKAGENGWKFGATTRSIIRGVQLWCMRWGCRWSFILCIYYSFSVIRGPLKNQVFWSGSKHWSNSKPQLISYSEDLEFVKIPKLDKRAVFRRPLKEGFGKTTNTKTSAHIDPGHGFTTFNHTSASSRDFQ